MTGGPLLDDSVRAGDPRAFPHMFRSAQTGVLMKVRWSCDSAGSQNRRGGDAWYKEGGVVDQGEEALQRRSSCTFPPHTLRFTGVLNGVEVSAATRSRRFGLKWRVAVAPSSATAAFLDASNTSCASVTPYNSGMRVASTYKLVHAPALETCVTLESDGYPWYPTATGLSPSSPHYPYLLTCTFLAIALGTRSSTLMLG
ncbi:hypothetical protein KCU99_g59, partial [Aureobasidium melanogenum]